MCSIYGYWLILIILIQQGWSDYSRGNHWTCCNNVVLTTYTNLCGDVSKQGDLSVEMLATLQTFFNPKSIWDTPFESLLENEYVYVLYIHILNHIQYIYNIIYVDSYNWLHWIRILYCQIEDTGELIKSHLTSRPLKWHLHGMRLPSNSVLWTTVVSRDLEKPQQKWLKRL